MAKLDEIDTVILQELVKDSGQSIPKLSRKIDVNASVVYSRICFVARLQASGPAVPPPAGLPREASSAR